MILVLGIIITISLFWAGHLIEKYTYSDAEIICYILGGVVAIAVIIAGVVAGIGHLTAIGTVERNQEIYDSLIYKMESTACRDEFGFLNKEVIDEVTEWNKDVRYYQRVQDDFWIGIMYPNVYDQFETIEYDSFVGKGAE